MIIHYFVKITPCKTIVSFTVGWVLKFLMIYFLMFNGNLSAQTAYFVDGFHGGVWGHYPKGYTNFIVNEMNTHPNWRINLEIEPETWDSEQLSDPKAYQDFKALLQDQSNQGRIEYVNPAYAQSYMFNVSGESMIRQFAYGIKKLKQHFPEIKFYTYSSEEPCFTSALPQVLTSFGFMYASLKNPNTCWGGYTRAFGKGLVNWIGPDGSSILTVPRYEVEALKPTSTWETIANGNSELYIKAAFDDGIKAPVGMCLQDAGWRFGPWLKGDFYQPTEYTTWRNYFQNIVNKDVKATDWKFSQEDVQVSLVWGAQVLQRIAQQVRVSENKIVQAEKIAAFRTLANQCDYPSKVFDQAWQALLLSQHHDCWIVPYNGEKGDTWADKTKDWTAFADVKSDSVMVGEFKPSVAASPTIQVYNSTLYDRNEWVSIKLSKDWEASETSVRDDQGSLLPSQVLKGDVDHLIFKAAVPAAGYSFFHLFRKNQLFRIGARIEKLTNGDYLMETDLYKITIDTKRGGLIKHLIAKELQNKDFVDAGSEQGFNELRGFFYNKGGFHSGADSAVSIQILENGPFRVSLGIKGKIAGEPYSQTITLDQGQKRIDLKVKIDWKQNEGIGEFAEYDYQDTRLHKAFYNDQYKLLTLFPLNLKGQKVVKNAPFDVTESKLKNTFFSSWDSIKNNVLLNWVDVVDEKDSYGCALYTDHTTSYTHGENFPLGLTIQYSGKGLWGRNYSLDGVTELSYTLIPHRGDWKTAGLWKESELINEPLKAVLVDGRAENGQRSFVHTHVKGWVLSSCAFDGDDLLIRIFNAEGNGEKGRLNFGFNPSLVQIEELNGKLKEKLSIKKTKNADSFIELGIPPFGLITIRLSGLN